MPWHSVRQLQAPKFSLQVKLHDIPLAHLKHIVQLLQYPLQVKHPVQLAHALVHPSLQLPVQLLTQVLQLDAHLEL